LAAGRVDTANFDAERAGRTAAQVWDEMMGQLPHMSVDPVVTHGDFTLDNVLIDGGEVAGCIDVARLGVADRYQDVALLWHDLGDLDTRLQQRLFDAYGIIHPDSRKLRFHLALDEYF
jgi:aminoglycoside 3'-phosphotransferase-1